MAVGMNDSLRFVKGVGERREKLYAKLGIHTVGELLYHLPRSYVDLRQLKTPETICPGDLAAVIATVASKSGEQRIRKGFSVFKVRAVGEKSTLTLTFFNTKFAVQALKLNCEYIFYGRVSGSLLLPEMLSPTIYPSTAHGLMPVYPATAGLSSAMIAANVATVMAQQPQIPETLPDELLLERELPALGDALRCLHHPNTIEELEQARRRLAFEELLCLGLGLIAMKRSRIVERIAPMQPVDLEDFYLSLPFVPTQGQREAVADSIADMCSGLPMNRLIQGDVGSGKTLVAAACCLFAHRNGYGSAMMAPTELLAVQHGNTLRALLEPMGMCVGLLTGSMTAGQKRRVRAQLEAGELDLIVGTHALIAADGLWARLGLVITDEQHRFGVAQRMSLVKKGAQTHTLIMSATPIPRTLGLIIYGDMELSVIRELPSGRLPVETYLIDGAKRQRAYGYIKKHLDRGLQGFVICPLVESDPEQPDSQMKAAVEYCDELQRGAFAGYRLGLLHGRMKPQDKDAVMKAFAQGQLDLLVATTVVEVGIDVPNACIMLIEDAERYGLSQLHQLRGRIGRGGEQSTCILVSDNRSPQTRERLKFFCSTTDGFKISEYDLETRGPGDFFGMAQHGLPPLRVAGLASDAHLLEETRELAGQLLNQDPELTRLPALRERVKRMMATSSVL